MPAPDMIAWGGGTFAQALARDGLIDEYRLITPRPAGEVLLRGRQIGVARPLHDLARIACVPRAGRGPLPHGRLRLNPEHAYLQPPPSAPGRIRTCNLGIKKLSYLQGFYVDMSRRHCWQGTISATHEGPGRRRQRRGMESARSGSYMRGGDAAQTRVRRICMPPFARSRRPSWARASALQKGGLQLLGMALYV